MRQYWGRRPFFASASGECYPRPNATVLASTKSAPYAAMISKLGVYQIGGVLNVPFGCIGK